MSGEPSSGVDVPSGRFDADENGRHWSTLARESCEREQMVGTVHGLGDGLVKSAGAHGNQGADCEQHGHFAVVAEWNALADELVVVRCLAGDKYGEREEQLAVGIGYVEAKQQLK